MNITTEAKAELVCLPLPEFDAENWNEVARIFAGMPVCHYGQPWRADVQPRWMPARTHIGYDAQHFWMFSVFEDIDVFNTCLTLNEHLSLRL